MLVLSNGYQGPWKYTCMYVDERNDLSIYSKVRERIHQWPKRYTVKYVGGDRYSPDCNIDC